MMSDLLPHTEIAINNLESATTGVTLFFFMDSIWRLDFTDETPKEFDTAHCPIKSAENIVSKLKRAREWAEASMASAQRDYEDEANVRRVQPRGVKWDESLAGSQKYMNGLTFLNT
ncbi:hypothetical protein PAAG_11626 [Paracoccidioides lutzii Pb01]|uniref:Uncharacterized protein n=1 Tax=Paracoccidioides lutzii (strain ATCC MYA-826 / Pb01) TaxID=502779 RepID=A0A0A2V2D9_PARBA|nr:hypothetical protein PAAG_11626 [Paracoccidioides lutzii Pb01]KGQ01643.1 hypothetical protein PAAG_11626 [Paracoccidioides lutzii Pb01]